MKTKILILIIYCLLYVECKAQWVPTGPPGGPVTAIGALGSTIFAGTSFGGIFVSTNNGQSWIQTSIYYPYVSAILVHGTIIFAGTSYGIFQSTDNGQNWTLENPINVNTFTSIGSNIFAGTSTGVYRSTDEGQTWVQTSLDKNIISLGSNNSTVFAGSVNGWIYFSSDNGQNWNTARSGSKNVYTIAVKGTNIFAGLGGGSPGSGVYVSTNNGFNWTQSSLGNISISSIAISGENIFAAAGLYLYLSTNNGQTWSKIATNENSFNVLLINNGNFFSGSNGLFKSSDNGQTWIQTSLSSLGVLSIAANSSTIYCGGYRGLFSSSNNGVNWTQKLSGAQVFTSLTAIDDRVLAGTIQDLLYYSTDNGLNWSLKSISYSISQIASVGINSQYLFAGTGIGNNEGLYISSNSGTSWTQAFFSSGCFAILMNGSDIYCGTRWAAVFHSTNNGTNWAMVSQISNVYLIYSLAMIGSDIFAGAWNSNTIPGGVYKSTDNAHTWIQTSFNISNVYSLAASGSNLVAGTDSGVYISTNEGISWTSRNEGMPRFIIRSTFIKDSYVYAGTWGSSIWRRPLSELVGINNAGNNIPDKFYLYQNYP
ncbi:MAG TPA: hypothetical protein VGK25_03140, partial [Ignavibacteria bacterium]